MASLRRRDAVFALYGWDIGLVAKDQYLSPLALSVDLVVVAARDDVELSAVDFIDQAIRLIDATRPKPRQVFL
jgi:hypothetical protein